MKLPNQIEYKAKNDREMEKNTCTHIIQYGTARHGTAHVKMNECEKLVEASIYCDMMHK